MATPGVGSIAFIQMQTDNPDDFTFVALQDLDAGEVISFTDAGWLASDGFRAGEDKLDWTVPAGGVEAGKVVTVANLFDDPVVSEGSAVRVGKGIILSSSGDQIIAFTGSLASPTPIAAIHSNGTGFQTDATSSNSSALPTGLVEGTTAIAIPEVDNMVYVGQTAGTASQLRAAINDPYSWLTDNSPFFLLDPPASFTLVCFAARSLIGTPGGEKTVEALAIGDLVQTADGRDVPVRWIGRQTVVKAFAHERASLVRIGPGALGNHTDLYVTGDHGMVVYPSSSEAIGGKNGCIVNASALVDGDGIVWVPLSETPDRFTVYHVETEAHDILLANGAPTESYIDLPGRSAFDNFAEYLDLYGAERPIAPNPLPRVSSRRLLRAG